MPRYQSRKKSRKVREKKRVRAQVPRDHRKLSHWAVRGTHQDYEVLRKHARDLEPEKPSYVSEAALNLLQNADRNKLIKAANQHENHWFTDGLAWLLDKIPRGVGFDWLRTLGEAGLKPFRGDHLSEVDSQYARLVNEAYKPDDERDATFEHWTHRPEFDSNYITVYDNQDGHRFIAVRGTKLNMQDLGQDLLIGARGRPQNLIGRELRRVLDNTAPGKIIDVGGHSLGTSLILTAYQNDKDMQNRVHETYLYNPAMSPFSKNVTQDYENDDRVRYFIDVLDPVSVGGIGDMGPKNVVYRTSFGSPLAAHRLVSWGGADGLAEHDEELGNYSSKDDLPIDTNRDGIPDFVPDNLGANDDTFDLDFGTSFNNEAWNVYWTQ